MNKVTTLPQDETIACNICLKEIPISEAKSEEAIDYVLHFCGLDCYSKWKEQENKEQDSKAQDSKEQNRTN